MSAEESKPLVIEGIKIEEGQQVFIREHRGCTGNIGKVYGIGKVSCNTCGRSDVVLDVPTTLELLTRVKKL